MDQEGTLSIRVNGEHRRVRAGLSLSELALELGLQPTKVAVERNLEIVPRAQYAATTLVAGDALEVVTFVGGG